MRRLIPEELLRRHEMETADLLEEGGDFERIRRGVVLFGLGWLGLACLAIYADYRIKMRRARKRREAKEGEKRT